MDIDPEKRTGLLEQAALAGEEEIGGLTLCPMTYGTHSFYQRIQIACEEQGNVDENFAKAAFVFIHSKPKSYLASQYPYPKKLAAEIAEFMLEHPFGYFAQFDEWAARQMAQYRASITASAGAGTDDPKV
jgi:hypothetical protein